MLDKAKNTNFDITDNKYLSLLQDAKQKIISTRIQVAKSASREQFNLYWWFGERIIEAQEKYGWGRSVIEQLAKDLRAAFPDTTYGFSTRNLWDMRRFYLEYKNLPFLRQLVAEIPWGQNLVILNKVKESGARQYYLEMTHKLCWTRSTLVMQINAQAYEQHHLIKKQNNFIHALPQHLAEQADHAMKDIYMLDTLGLTKPVLEAEIENSMVNKIKTVMLALGYGFSFIGNQHRIVAGGNEYFRLNNFHIILKQNETSKTRCKEI